MFYSLRPLDCRPPGSSVHGFSRQEHWSGLPSPPPGDLPTAGMEPASLVSLALAVGLFTTGATWEGSLPTPLFSLPSRTSPSAVGPAVLGCEKQWKKKCLQTRWNILDHLGRREQEGESPCHPLLAFCPGDAPQIGWPVGWTDAMQGTTAGSLRMAWFCIHGETTGQGGNWTDSQLPWVRGTGQGERHIPPSCGCLSDAQTS